MKLSILLLLVTLLALDACKITLKARSRTKTPFQLQVYIPSLKQKTERVTFNGPGEKKVLIEGGSCMDKKWVFKTWKQVDGKWVGAAQNSGKLGGSGWFRVIVEDNLMPFGNDRYGIACSEGAVCG
ncbi:unnamed protein product [Bursaphelenchus xylophilus]|uniref:(pine wood nematode) hypothetical protein n=1 Tax=Bursaphelenchus xylophilus TaxID=6326 RepID=A0A1I7S8V4_BURXY|nr:unnamed protein product [Bursaphelenchus xylophilus]CAG9085908.1 unnamed protein product [Bursaphelenchus xylophilus]